VSSAINQRDQLLTILMSCREELALKIGLTEARIQVISVALIYCNFYDLCDFGRAVITRATNKPFVGSNPELVWASF
jgi:hypothetical protein